MPKNLVVCCDGTANEFKRDRTNVVRLFYTLVRDPQQVAFYHPGIGTMAAVGALTTWSREVTKLLGLAIGYGLEADICDAYVYIMNNFEPGDRLFLFGFSRGAYTVRIVTGLLRMYGLISPGNAPLVPYAIRMLMAVNRLHKGATKGPPAAPHEANAEKPQDSKIKEIFGLADAFRQTFCGLDCKPHFVGVWDTVSSVGWIENPIHVPYTATNADIAIARHAVSIDEHRAFFRTNLWALTEKGGPKDLKQVWFPGVHCDVGGGYPESESGLSKVALEWMLREAIAAGLLTDSTRVDTVLGRAGGGYVAPNPKADMHESLTPVWSIAEFIPKRHFNWDKKKDEYRMNLFGRRVIPPQSMIHQAAYERGPEYQQRLPADAIVVT